MPKAMGLLGFKVGMTQVFNDDGSVEPVTVIEVGPCPVLQLRTKEVDGYVAVQLGFRDKKRKNARRSEQGHVASKLQSKRKDSRTKAGVQLLPKADCEPQRHVREFRLDAADTKVKFVTTQNGETKTEEKAVAVGQVLKVADVFAEVKSVDVIGTSKGRGYQGVMRRHNFDGLPAAHGAKKVHRQAGSTSSLASNRGSGRPKKGLKRAGQYGNARRTVRNLKVIRIDADNNLILVRGSVPGFNGAFVLVRPTNKFKSVHNKVVVQQETKTKIVLQKKGK